MNLIINHKKKDKLEKQSLRVGGGREERLKY